MVYNVCCETNFFLEGLYQDPPHNRVGSYLIGVVILGFVEKNIKR